jgi:hypothetical protein
MKKLILNISFNFLSILLFGQIDKNLTNEDWSISVEKVIYENTITRVQGINNIKGVTNLGFQTFEQKKNYILKKAENEMWTDEKKNDLIKSYEKIASGGIFHLYLTRLTIEAANTKMFTLIIKDSNDNQELFRKELDKSLPQLPSIGSDYWWNYSNICLSYKISGRVFVYIIDKLDTETPRYKFQLYL